jgi:hypothetical protein
LVDPQVPTEEVFRQAQHTYQCGDRRHQLGHTVLAVPEGLPGVPASQPQRKTK